MYITFQIFSLYVCESEFWSVAPPYTPSAVTRFDIHVLLELFLVHIYSVGLIWRVEVLYFLLPLYVCLSHLHPHILVLSPHRKFKRPAVAMGTILALSAHLSFSWREVICPLSVPHTHAHTSSSFTLPTNPSSPSLQRKKNPILHSQEAWLFLLLFFLSDSFTHNVWHQQPPLLLLSLPLYTAFISMCAYTLACFFHKLKRKKNEWGRDEMEKKKNTGECASAADFHHTGWVYCRYKCNWYFLGAHKEIV